MKKNMVILIVLAILAAIVIASIGNTKSEERGLKIGVITPLSGGSAYWGESTQVGIKMAQSELQAKGINVSFIVEDGQLDPKVALNAAQKLVNVDKVQAIYSEFNPASIAVSSFLKDKNVFHLYDSAAVSPLDAGPYNFKTYLDYQEGCKKTALYIKNAKSVEKVGVLKINIEFGDLCVKGIQEIHGDSVVVESYDPGETDFRTALTKLSRANVDAIFNPSFQAETITSLQQMQDLRINKLFVGLEETITPDMSAKYSDLIQGDIFFGLPRVSAELIAKIKAANGGKDVANYNAASLAYVHLIQLATSVNTCGTNNDCIAKQLENSSANSDVGFEGFTQRIAKFKSLISEWKNGSLIEVK